MRSRVSWAVVIAGCLSVLSGVSPSSAAEGGAPSTYPGTVPPGKSTRAYNGPAVGIRLLYTGGETGAKANVQYLHADKKQAAKYTPLEFPAEVTFAVNPPRNENKAEQEYRLVFTIAAGGATNTLYGRLLIYRQTEFTQNSIVKVEITDAIVKAVAAGEVQIIKVKDPQISAALAAGGVNAPGKGKKEPVIPGVGPEEILSLTLGNRAFTN